MELYTILDLPNEMALMLFMQCDVSTVMTLSSTCCKYQDIYVGNERVIWERLYRNIKVMDVICKCKKICGGIADDLFNSMMSVPAIANYNMTDMLNEQVQLYMNI